MATNTSRLAKSARRNSCSWCKSGSVRNTNRKRVRISLLCTSTYPPARGVACNEKFGGSDGSFRMIEGGGSTHLHPCKLPHAREIRMDADNHNLMARISVNQSSILVLAHR